METKIVCPLGCECQRAVDGVLEQCAWYTKIQGTNPQNGEKIDEYRCAIVWMPLLTIEGNAESRTIGASVQSLRNETIKKQTEAIKVIENVKAIANK